MRPLSNPTNNPRPKSVATSAWIALALAVYCVAGTGCSNIQSQAANVEGVRLYQQGNYQQASDRFQQAIAQNPKSPEGYYNLAASLHKTGTLYNRPADLQQAENLYNQCLERDPNHTECYRGLAVLLNETNRQPEAFKLLNHWASSNPKSADPKIEVARLLEEVGQQEQAKAQLVDALTIDPHNARADRAGPAAGSARRPPAGPGELPAVSLSESLPTRGAGASGPTSRRRGCAGRLSPRNRGLRIANRRRCAAADAILMRGEFTSARIATKNTKTTKQVVVSFCAFCGLYDSTAAPDIASMIARQKWGRSSGLRLETKLRSTTTGASFQIAPAFSRSSLIPGEPVTRTPR